MEVVEYSLFQINSNFQRRASTRTIRTINKMKITWMNNKNSLTLTITIKITLKNKILIMKNPLLSVVEKLHYE